MEAAADEKGQRGHRRSPDAGRQQGWACIEEMQDCHLRFPSLRWSAITLFWEGGYSYAFLPKKTAVVVSISRFLHNIIMILAF
ncbi:hypothetical protein DXT63_16480 [Thermoanaerobacteraceae bacterium SP2]|nr:hypothetical protein DXT63_16480 [Thermoanaerobacteraceae bacterium SP2]